MVRYLLIATAFLMIGCNSTESENSPALSGAYQHEEIASDGTLTSQVEFKSGSEFIAKSYAPDGGGNYCQLDEASGKWSYEDGKLTLTNRKSRERETGLCEDVFSSYSDLSDRLIQVRNLTAASFEMYAEGDSDLPGAWVKYTKL